MKEKEEFEIEEKQIDTLLIAGYRMKGKYSDVGKEFSLLIWDGTNDRGHGVSAGVYIYFFRPKLHLGRK